MSGPARLEENGTLKDRLTIVSAGVSGDMGDETTVDLIDWEIGSSM